MSNVRPYVSDDAGIAESVAADDEDIFRTLSQGDYFRCVQMNMVARASGRCGRGDKGV